MIYEDMSNNQLIELIKDSDELIIRLTEEISRLEICLGMKARDMAGEFYSEKEMNNE